MFRGYFGSFLDSMMGSGGRGGRQSNLDKLLEEGGKASLEQVLNDSEILTECKWGNSRLMNYFDHDKLAELIDLITQMPPVDATHDRGHKLPFIASELFNCELNKLNDLFFTSRADEEEKTASKQSLQDKKHVSSSPLPKNDDDDEEDEDDQEDHSDDEEHEEEENKKSENITSSSVTVDNQEDDKENQSSVASANTIPNEEEVKQVDQAVETSTNTTDNGAAVTDTVTNADEQKEESTPQTQTSSIDCAEHKEKEAIVDIEVVEEESKEQPVIPEASHNDQITQDQEDESKQDENLLESNLDFESGEGIEHLDHEESTAPSTLPEVANEKNVNKSNKYELFERLLSFLDTNQELNPVLCGYFQKLFQVLVSSKTKDVFTYIYTHPIVFDNLVRHSYQKSISDVLIRLFNTQENLFHPQEISYQEVTTLRTSYVHKIIEKLSPAGSLEDQLNAQQILSDIADYKVLYLEMLSDKAFEKYREYLGGESDSSKAQTYVLLSLLMCKYQSHMQDGFKSKANNNTSKYGFHIDDEDDDDEIINNNNNNDTKQPHDETKTFHQICGLIIDFVAKELRAHDYPESPNHERQYGLCHKPFGVMRMRAVEFLQEAFRVFFKKELHDLLVACDLYNRLLYFFDKYPFHNILHQKICDIFVYLLDKSSESEDIINSVLYDTDLVKKILDTSRDGSSYTLKSTSLTVTSGYMPFVRKLANKLHSLSTTSKIEEIANFLDSIPEWNDFLNNQLMKQNEIESKQLGNKKNYNDANNSDNNINNNNDEEEEEEDQEGQENIELAMNEDLDKNSDLMSLNKMLFKINQIGNKKGSSNSDSKQKKQGNNDEEDSDSDEDDDNDDNLFSSTSKGPLFSSKLTKNDEEEEDDDEQEEVFDRLLKKRNEDTANYASSRPGTPAINHINSAVPSFNVQNSAHLPEKTEYHEHFYWQTNLIENSQIDDLLKDYQ